MDPTSVDEEVDSRMVSGSFTSAERSSFISVMLVAGDLSSLSSSCEEGIPQMSMMSYVVQQLMDSG